jgi:hypothetical protein
VVAKYTFIPLRKGINIDISYGDNGLTTGYGKNQLGEYLKYLQRLHSQMEDPPCES